MPQDALKALTYGGPLVVLIVVGALALGMSQTNTANLERRATDGLIRACEAYGYQQGHNDGYDSGYKEGWSRGYNQALKDLRPDPE